MSSWLVSYLTELYHCACVTQFYSPKGKRKAAFTFRNYNIVWGHTVSQDGR